MSLIIIALLQLSLLFPNVISTCSTTSNVQFTFYGYPDGPSDTTSFGCSGSTQVADGTAGGDGSYAHPETFATALDNPNFVPCEIIYIPLLQKYFQYMDHCEECNTLYPNTIRIDLWIGTDVNGGQKQIDCEDAFGLKTGQTIVRSPPSTLQVNSGQLWDNDSGTCGDGSLVFPSYDASEGAMCAGGSSSSSSSGAGGSPAPSSSSSSTSSPPSSPPTSTPSTAPATPQTKASTGGTTSEKEEVNALPKDNTAAKVADAKAPNPTTLATVVSAAAPPPPPSSSSPSSSTISNPSVPSPSASVSAGADAQDCGVTAEWPTAWLGHCVGAPCHEFNDCSGELICQGWPGPVCTSPRGGK